MNNYGIREDYRARLAPAYFEDVKPDGKTWQPDVLPIAAHLARLRGVKQLIDIGCGRGTGLIPYQGEFQITGVDYGTNLEYCRNTYEWGRWISCNLEWDASPLDVIDFKGVGLVCSDVIEHLVNPEHLLVTFMTALICADFLVLSTPDRLRTYGYDRLEPPMNVHHTREWTLDEMTALLESCGLGIAWRGWTLSNNVDRLKNTMLLIVTRRDKVYNIREELAGFEAEAKT